jgi:hypothetical protein
MFEVIQCRCPRVPTPSLALWTLTRAKPATALASKPGPRYAVLTLRRILMTATHYRHTQIGRLMLLALVLPAGFIALFLATTQLWVPLGLVLGVLLVCAVLFSTLTVEVDARQLRFRFGPGLIRKRINLADVRHFAAVRNPWWYGWGIHLTPRGVLYNVSGLGAVELHLDDGKRLRIGTDEPEALCRALEQVLGACAPLSDSEAAQAQPRARTMLIVLLSTLALIAVGMAAVFHFHEQPPTVTVTADRFRVASALYDEEYAFADITQLSLETRLPRIRLRTNGYAAGGTLRGHFRLDEWGDGQLFVAYGHPPYVVVRRGTGYVVVNFANPGETIALYRQLEPLWQAARGR